MCLAEYLFYCQLVRVVPEGLYSPSGLKALSLLILEAASWFLWSSFCSVLCTTHIHYGTQTISLLNKEHSFWEEILAIDDSCQTIYKWKGVWRLWPLLVSYEVLGNKEAMIRTKWCWFLHFSRSDSAYLLIVMHPVRAISWLSHFDHWQHCAPMFSMPSSSLSIVI